MKRGKAVALVAAGLVAGLVLGSLGIASAVTTSSERSATTSEAPAWCPGPVWRAGKAVGAAGGRLGDIVAKLTGLTETQVHDQREAGKSLADIAELKGVSSDKVVNEALKVRKDLLDQQVKAGTITQEQADEMLANMESRLKERVEATGAPGSRDGMRGMRGGMGARGGAGLIDQMSDLTGLSVQTIIERRQGGESLAAIAKSEGVSVQRVVDEAFKTRQAFLDARVKDGRITQAQADEALKRMKERLTEAMVSSQTPSERGGADGMRDGRGGMGRGGMGHGAGETSGADTLSS